MINPALRLPVRALGVLTAALLAIDAYVHLHDAGLYDGGTGITEGALFRVQACVAVVVALALARLHGRSPGTRHSTRDSRVRRGAGRRNADSARSSMRGEGA